MKEKSTSPQADVIRHETQSLQLAQKLDGSEEEVAQLQTRSNELWYLSEPTQYSRDAGDLSQELEWMPVEENQPRSGATGSGSVGTENTTLIAIVEPSSFRAAGDCLPVHFCGSKIVCCPESIQTSTQNSNVHVEKPEQVERETQLSRNKETEKP